MTQIERKGKNLHLPRALFNLLTANILDHKAARKQDLFTNKVRVNNDQPKNAYCGAKKRVCGPYFSPSARQRLSQDAFWLACCRQTSFALQRHDVFEFYARGYVLWDEVYVSVRKSLDQ